ncbi:hypothetical protein H4R34_000775 [Dimargaris verticillata]|uniref:Methyltransferase type 11 domain-containing protein n=1 Tax=Dimargaris verticillata TaxID=2761393 RepID=A0A9W8EEE0_9FUNG|nr:hypothetical protein H4R34_000775 [Dimargaris verticillata]
MATPLLYTCGIAPRVGRIPLAAYPYLGWRQRLSTTRNWHAQEVFNRTHKRQQKDRAAQRVENSRHTDYLRNAIAEQLVDRLRDIRRRFPTIVELGAHSGFLRRHLDPGMTDKVIQCDLSEAMVQRDRDRPTTHEATGEPSPVPAEYQVVDEEALPFAENSLEAVVSNLSLHWVNDLPGALIQIQRALVPDGMFLGAMLGGDTLFELRTSLQLAEVERENGISPRVSPMTDPRDMTDLLQRAGFALTTVDVDDLTVDYPTPLALMQDLRAMGESNATLLRDTLLAASSIYKELYGTEEGHIPATFQIIFMIGWKPDSSQPQPKARGSATVSLKDVLKS